MKVLLTCSSSSRTGAVEGLISLGEWARARGIDARFGGDTVRAGENLDEHLARAGVPWERSLRLSRKVRAGDVLHDARTLPQMGFDLIHCAMAHDHSLALWAKWRTGVRVVRAVQRAVDVPRLWMLRRSDGVIAHATQYVEQLRAAGLPRVTYVPGHVDAARFTPGEPRMRAQWGIPAGVPVIGIVARMKPERGHRELLAAFARHVPAPTRLVLIGRGEFEPDLRRLARDTAPRGSAPGDTAPRDSAPGNSAPGNSAPGDTAPRDTAPQDTAHGYTAHGDTAHGDRVVFGGYARGDELVEAYRSLDAAVWLREGNDGSCRGVLEAMSCGVPVVGGSIGAPRDYIEEGLSGRIVDPSDIDAIGKALVDVLARSRELGRAARARAATFTADRAHEATLALWRSTGVRV